MLLLLACGASRRDTSTILMPSKSGPSGATFSRKRFKKLLDDEERERTELAAREAAIAKGKREAAKAKAIAERDAATAALQARLQQYHEQTQQVLNANLMGGAQAPHALHQSLIHTAAMHAMGHAARQMHEENERKRREKDDQEALAILLGE